MKMSVEEKCRGGRGQRKRMGTKGLITISLRREAFWTEHGGRVDQNATILSLWRRGFQMVGNHDLEIPMSEKMGKR